MGRRRGGRPLRRRTGWSHLSGQRRQSNVAQKNPRDLDGILPHTISAIRHGTDLFQLLNRYLAIPVAAVRSPGRSRFSQCDCFVRTGRIRLTDDKNQISGIVCIYLYYTCNLVCTIRYFYAYFLSISIKKPKRHLVLKTQIFFANSFSLSTDRLSHT